MCTNLITFQIKYLQFLVCCSSMSPGVSLFENQLHPFRWLGHLIMMFFTKRFIMISLFTSSLKIVAALHRHFTPISTSSLCPGVNRKRLSIHFLQATQLDGQLIKWGSSRISWQIGHNIFWIAKNMFKILQTYLKTKKYYFWICRNHWQTVGMVHFDCVILLFICTATMFPITIFSGRASNYLSNIYTS